MLKISEVVRRLSSTQDIPVVAGSSTSNPKAEELKQVPCLIAAPFDDTLYTASEGITLVALDPLTYSA